MDEFILESFLRAASGRQPTSEAPIDDRLTLFEAACVIDNNADEIKALLDEKDRFSNQQKLDALHAAITTPHRYTQSACELVNIILPYCKMTKKDEIEALIYAKRNIKMFDFLNKNFKNKESEKHNQNRSRSLSF